MDSSTRFSMVLTLIWWGEGQNKWYMNEQHGLTGLKGTEGISHYTHPHVLFETFEEIFYWLKFNSKLNLIQHDLKRQRLGITSLVSSLVTIFYLEMKTL